MCGIFGIVSNSNVNLEKINFDIKSFVKYSEARGSDTFGVSLKVEGLNYVFKENEKPSDVLKKDEYKNFFYNNLADKEIKKIMLIGQTRLVTNGSKFSYKNNQPLLTNNIIGIHNGIFTNLDDKNETRTKNYESYNVKSDSLIFFEKVSEIANKENFLIEYQKYLKSVKGNYSVAFKLRDENKIFLSSNCGSLYYYHDDDFFCFGSEKNFNKLFKSFKFKK